MYIRILRVWVVAWLQLLKIHRHFGMSCQSHHLGSRRLAGTNGLDKCIGLGVGDIEWFGDVGAHKLLAVDTIQQPRSTRFQDVY